MTQLTNGTHRKRVKLVKENARNYNGQKGTVYIHITAQNNNQNFLNKGLK
jgi:hypothetical protein